MWIVIAQDDMRRQSSAWREFCLVCNYGNYDMRPGIIDKFADWLEHRERAVAGEPVRYAVPDE